MICYADTNFITRLFVDLPESPRAQSILADGQRKGIQRLPITWLLEVETSNAIFQSVFLSRNTGQIRVTIEHALIAHSRFKSDAAGGLLFRRKHLATEDLAMKTEELVLRHTAKQGFRTYDLMHVASALLLECDTFWSFDARARKAAAMEGLSTAG